MSILQRLSCKFAKNIMKKHIILSKWSEINHILIHSFRQDQQADNQLADSLLQGHDGCRSIVPFM